MILNRALFSLIVVFTLLLAACEEEKSQSEADNQHTYSTPSPSSVQTSYTAQDLRNAALEGRIKIVKEAAGQDVDVNAADQFGRTALMLAAYNGHTEVARFLLEQGADVHAQNADGRTSLIFAASGPFPETVDLLLNQGAEADVRDKGEGWTALMFAAAGGHTEVVQTLLDHGADALLKDKDGEKAIDFARNNNHPEVTSLLEKAANN